MVIRPTRTSNFGCLIKARFHRRFLSQQLNATQCNFCRAELANSCDFIAIFCQCKRQYTSIALTKAVCLLKGETATQSHRVSSVVSHTAAINC